MKKVICAHLYNDFSGSPLVLSNIIKTFRAKGLTVEILTSSEEPGFLSDLNVKIISNDYKFVNNRYFRLVLFLMCQIKMFFQTLRYRKEPVVIYVNTLLPFGVALAGKLMGKKVIYHFHETSLKPLLLKKFLKWVAAKTASQVIYVSKFLEETEKLPSVAAKVIYNCLSDEFVKKAKESTLQPTNHSTFRVLMLCSLKTYKGVHEFVDLASKLPSLSFDLVLNAAPAEINHFFDKVTLPKNLYLFPKQSNVHPFFKRASLVLNLSHPEEWIETFGMTLIEAMQYGLPVIAPPVGGPAEIVVCGVNGYLIDQRNKEELFKSIIRLAMDKQRYHKMSQNAIQHVERYSKKQVENQLLQLVG